MSAATVMQRPIFGGVFGRDRYTLATVPCVARGLHSVRFMVIDPRAGAVLSVAEDKVDALASARRVLRATAVLTEPPPLDDGAPLQQTLWPEDPIGTGANPLRGHPPSKRRREIFRKSAGRCHYCSATLQLDGKWHVEHMMPRALGGTDNSANLVAACVRCNLGKRDRTAIEYVSETVAHRASGPDSGGS